MIQVTADVQGLQDLERRLRALDLNKQQKAIKSAGRAAFKPVLLDAQANVPVDSGLLRDSLRIASRTVGMGSFPIEIGLTLRNAVTYEDAEGAALIRATFGKRGVKLNGRRVRGKGRRIRIDTGAGWRWHFIETGVPSRGIAPRPFLRPALERNKEAVVQVFQQRLAQVIERLARS